MNIVTCLALHKQKRNFENFTGVKRGSVHLPSPRRIYLRCTQANICSERKRYSLGVSDAQYSNTYLVYVCGKTIQIPPVKAFPEPHYVLQHNHLLLLPMNESRAHLLIVGQYYSASKKLTHTPYHSSDNSNSVFGSNPHLPCQP